MDMLLYDELYRKFQFNVEHTFTPCPPKDPNPCKTAYPNRSVYLAATKFKAFVLPPLDEDARLALEKTLLKWLSAGGIDEIDEVDENERSTETKVREEYDAVLKLLEEGIDTLFLAW
jgi:hypothetical protein